MFDIGFTEILVIAVIALFVVGPERLPETVRTVGLWIGRFKRSLREARRELELQIGADEIRRELHNEEVMKNLENLRKDVSDTLNQKIDIDEDEDFYPPGHHDHDPNNDIHDELGNPATNRPAPPPASEPNTADTEAPPSEPESDSDAPAKQS